MRADLVAVPVNWKPPPAMVAAIIVQAGDDLASRGERRHKTVTRGSLVTNGRQLNRSSSNVS
jgi:hypothetical protein